MSFADEYFEASIQNVDLKSSLIDESESVLFGHKKSNINKELKLDFSRLLNRLASPSQND